MSPTIDTEFWYRLDGSVERAQIALHAPQPLDDGSGFSAEFEYSFGPDHQRLEAHGADEWQAFTIGLHMLSLQVQHYLVDRGARLFWNRSDADSETKEAELSSFFGGLRPGSPSQISSS